MKKTPTKKPEKKVLLVNPYLTTHVYEKSKVKGQVHPSLTLATIAGPLVDKGHNVKVLDLTISDKPIEDLKKELTSFQPDYVGITFTTSSFSEFKRLCDEVKKHNNKIPVIAGGPHASASPEKVMNESQIDILVIGEGDFTFLEIIENPDLKDVKGIAYRNKSKIVFTKKAEYIDDLDKLPMPAWHLFDLKKYKNPRSFGRSPLGAIETSRGCPFQCIYCNKNIFGYKYRTKSSKRVVEEFKYLKTLGFKEVYIADDGFTTMLDRAKEVCDLLIKENVKLAWNLGNGVRVDRVDLEFLKKARKAGCYRVHFGIEAANEQLLKRIKKGITIEQVKYAFMLAKKAGMDTVAYFMYGFPEETEQTMQECIDLAIELDPDFARVAIVIPYPGTELWDEWNNKGIIKSFDWSKYTFHNTYVNIYDHPDIDMKLIYKYYDKFYKDFYYRPLYLIKRAIKGAIRGTIFFDGYYFIKNFVLGK